MEKEKNTTPLWEKYALTLEEAAEWSGIGIHTLRKISDNPRNNFTLYIGRKRLLKRKALEAYLDKQLEL